MTTPSVARMYDYYLGGKDNFAADREAAEQVLASLPGGREVFTENRRFLGRAVRFLAAEAGIRQFIDLGSGLPTQHNVHEIARRYAPDARVVYVDNDPIVAAHNRELLSGTSNTVTVEADLRHPEAILSHRNLTELIDLDEPVAVLFIAILHFIADADDPEGVIARFRHVMAPGSYLALSHGKATPEIMTSASVYDRASSSVFLRSTDDITNLFRGFDLIEPGLTELTEWRPDPDVPSASVGGQWILAGVGRKPT